MISCVNTKTRSKIKRSKIIVPSYKGIIIIINRTNPL